MGFPALAPNGYEIPHPYESVMQRHRKRTMRGKVILSSTDLWLLLT